MKVPTKKAAALTAAIRNEPRTEPYQKSKPLSNTKNKLFAEIRNLFCLLGNPFLSTEEETTCELLIRSTVRKLGVLQSRAAGGEL